jgi:CcmD family protein
MNVQCSGKNDNNNQVDKNFNMNKNIFKTIAFSVTALLLTISSFAQDKVEMADAMRSNGKIYVVVTVCLVILIGLFLYVTSIDRKVRKLEKELK